MAESRIRTGPLLEIHSLESPVEAGRPKLAREGASLSVALDPDERVFGWFGGSHFVFQKQNHFRPIRVMFSDRRVVFLVTDLAGKGGNAAHLFEDAWKRTRDSRHGTAAVGEIRWRNLTTIECLGRGQRGASGNVVFFAAGHHLVPQHTQINVALGVR